MVIRPATASDAPAVAAVHVASWQGGYRGTIPDEVLDGPDLPARRLRGWQQLLGEPGPKQVNFLAEAADGRVVGLLHGGPTRDDDGDGSIGEVVAIYVSPDAWGTGAGRELMAAGLAALREAGFAVVTLWVLEGNVRARRFYERAGFAPDGAEMDDVLAGAVIREVRYRRGL